MPFILKSLIHSTLVDAVYNEIVSRRSNYYYFIGRVLEWADPNNPEAPKDTLTYELNTRNRIISVKKIQPTDVSYIVRRIDWSANTVYDQYDGDYSSNLTSASSATSLKSSNFYVLSSQFHVYKCLDNNNNGNSIVEPSGTFISPIETADGYKWKYMYTIPLSSRNRFLTNDYMPVTKAVTNSFYSRGEIDKVIIDNPGSGYLSNSEVTLTVSGKFVGASGNSIANLRPIFNSSGSIVDVVIKNAGNNYSNANIIITDNAGTGKSLYKNLVKANVFNAGSGYIAAAVANTTANIYTYGAYRPNANAVVSLVFKNNTLTDLVILNGGEGYNTNAISNTTITISTSGVFQPTTNAQANLHFATTAILTPVVVAGLILDVVVEDPGVGYNGNIQTTITITGNGSNASLLPYINDAGQLEDVIIESRGQGYTYADIAVIGDGQNANAFVNFSSGDLDSIQRDVELSAVEGAIYNIRIDNPGNGYSTASVTLEGDGSGFLGTVNISNSNTISSISVTNPGFGYTYANVIFTGNGLNAEATAIISPSRGHGFDAVKELYADALMFYSAVDNERIHNITIENDFRQFGILKDIKQYNNNRAYVGIVGTSCYLVTFDTILNDLNSTITKDLVLQLSTDPSRRFEVIEVSSNNQVILTSVNNYNLSVGDVLLDETTDSLFTIVAINNFPSINKFSGDMLYIDNRITTSNVDQQVAVLRTILKL